MQALFIVQVGYDKDQVSSQGKNPSDCRLNRDNHISSV